MCLCIKGGKNVPGQTNLRFFGSLTNAEFFFFLNDIAGYSMH